MIHRPEELSLWLEYFDGKEVYRIKTAIRPDFLFTTDAREAVSYAARDMVFKMEKDILDRA